MVIKTPYSISIPPLYRTHAATRYPRRYCAGCLLRSQLKGIRWTELSHWTSYCSNQQHFLSSNRKTLLHVDVNRDGLINFVATITQEFPSPQRNQIISLYEQAVVSSSMSNLSKLCSRGSSFMLTMHFLWIFKYNDTCY